MILDDYHVHTCFSTDSESPLESVLRQAVKLGLGSICITDHMDRDYPASDVIFVFDVGQYFDALQSLQAKYRDRIKVRIGIELGLRNEVDARDKVRHYYEELVESHSFDFIIGSTHVIDHGDPYNESFWEGKDAEEVIRDYYESIIENVDYYDCFNVYGHLDYILRYVPGLRHGIGLSGDGLQGNMDLLGDILKKNQDLFDDVLKKIISHGKGIELNTSTYRYGLVNPCPMEEILFRYRKLGGEIVTIGSDAHEPNIITDGFERAGELLLSLGYKYYAVFEGQRPMFVKI